VSSHTQTRHTNTPQRTTTTHHNDAPQRRTLHTRKHTRAHAHAHTQPHTQTQTGEQAQGGQAAGGHARARRADHGPGGGRRLMPALHLRRRALVLLLLLLLACLGRAACSARRAPRGRQPAGSGWSCSSLQAPQAPTLQAQASCLSVRCLVETRLAALRRARHVCAGRCCVPVLACASAHLMAAAAAADTGALCDRDLCQTGRHGHARRPDHHQARWAATQHWTHTGTPQHAQHICASDRARGGGDDGNRRAPEARQAAMQHLRRGRERQPLHARVCMRSGCVSMGAARCGGVGVHFRALVWSGGSTTAGSHL
jgi:hypothetical protein